LYYSSLPYLYFKVAWGGPVPPDPTEGLDPNGLSCKNVELTAGEATVDVYKLEDGYCYPAGIFTKPTAPDGCEFDHYHYTLLSIDGTQSRLDEGDCGAATSMEVENKGPIHVSTETVEKWNLDWAALQTEADEASEFTLE
jgi:hypothetical protein